MCAGDGEEDLDHGVVVGDDGDAEPLLASRAVVTVTRKSRYGSALGHEEASSSTTRPIVALRSDLSPVLP